MKNADLLFIRSDRGHLVAMTPEAQERVQKIPAGKPLKVTIREARNVRFHRKFFALLKFAFDIWSERCPGQEYQGHKVTPNFDRFRKDITVLAGFYDPVFGVDGRMRLEPHSLSFDRMTEEQFADLYSATIDVLIQKVLPDLELTRDDLDAAVLATLEFA